MESKLCRGGRRPTRFALGRASPSGTRYLPKKVRSFYAAYSTLSMSHAGRTSDLGSESSSAKTSLCGLSMLPHVCSLLNISHEART